jgi:hypothetical protein
MMNTLDDKDKAEPRDAVNSSEEEIRMQSNTNTKTSS